MTNGLFEMEEKKRLDEIGDIEKHKLPWAVLHGSKKVYPAHAAAPTCGSLLLFARSGYSRISNGPREPWILAELRDTGV